MSRLENKLMSLNNGSFEGLTQKYKNSSMHSLRERDSQKETNRRGRREVEGEDLAVISAIHQGRTQTKVLSQTERSEAGSE